MKYYVYMEQLGTQVQVGTISGTDSDSAYFAYDFSYFSSENAKAISVSLPLQREPFSPKQTRNFFDGALPEGFTRQSIAQQLHLDVSDYLPILHALGQECPGAIRIATENEKIEPEYKSFSDQQMYSLAAEGVSKCAKLVTEMRLSLAGAPSKIGMYLDEDENAWYLPKGTAPSTHVIKLSNARLKDILINEQLVLKAAEKCGIVIPRGFLINTGDGKNKEVLFATQRYDRTFTNSNRTIDGKRCPLRLHQEDFAQALGIPSAKRYEVADGNYLVRMFELLRKRSANPIADQIQLWDRIVFNYLVGNTDAYIKNFSLLYLPNLKSLRLSPAYDMVCTLIHGGTNEMAFAIGNAKTLNEVTEHSFRIAAKAAGLSEQLAMKRYAFIQQELPQALKTSAEELTALGADRAEKICKKILTTAPIGA